MNDYIDFDELIYLRMKPDEQELFEKGNFTPEHARIFLDISSDDLRKKVLKKAYENDLNPLQTREMYYKLIKNEKIKGNSLPTQIYINTIDNVVEKILNRGVKITSVKNETPNYFECIIRIPK